MPDRYEKGMELLRRFKEDRISFYKPSLPSKYSKQDIFHLSTAHTRAVLGGNRVGKSVMGVSEAIWNSTCEYPEWYPQESRWTAPTITRIIVKDFEDSVMKVINPLIEEFMPDKFLSVDKKIGKVRKNTRGVPIEYTLSNGSKLHILTHEQDTMQFEGAKYHNLWEDEPCPRDKHVASMRGLIDYHGKCWMTLTPIGIDADWIYDDIYLGDDPDIFWMNLDIRDNPYLSKEAIKQFEKQLSPDEIESRLHGKFMRMSGLVFKEWEDKEPYVIEPFQIPDDWTRIRAIDPHLRKAMAILWCAVDPDNNLYVYDELHMKGLVSTISETILDKTNGEHIQYTVIDNSANAPDVITGVNIRNEFSRCGVPTLLASKDVISGINRIHEYLKLNSDKNSEVFGQPRLFMFKTCNRLRWEFKHYIWNPNKEDEEKVRKKGDDMVDGLRYILNSRPFYRKREMDIDNYDDDYETNVHTGYQRARAC